MISEVKLTDLIDVATLQRIQDSFGKMTRMAALIADENGVALTVGTNFSEYCNEFCRKSPIGKKRCEECDKMGAFQALRYKKPYSYYCHANLVDFAAPIMLGDRVIGSFIGGQVLAAPPDLDRMRRIAKEIQVDEEAFVEAARKTHIVPKSAIERSAEFIYEFASIVSSMAYKAFEASIMGKKALEAAKQESDFLANMSHEIRTPMNAILGMAEMVLREEMTTEAREYLHQIQSSGKNLLVIINDILDFSKIESGKMDIIEVSYEPFSLINDISAIVNSRIGDKNLEFVLDIPYSIPCRLIGDNVRIHQVLINLLNNAVKFTRQGMVCLKLEFIPTGDNEVIMRAQVKDTGIGIKNEDMSKVFGSFQQVDSKRNRNIEGTGLGLAISLQLMKLMNGTITVESEYEKGSTFTIELPQKIDGEPYTLHRPSEPVNVAVLIRNPYLKAQIDKDLKAIGLEYKDLSTGSSLEEVTSGYLIICREAFGAMLYDFAEHNPHINIILLERFDNTDLVKMPNVKTLRKPVYSLNLYAALHLCDELSREVVDESSNFVFTAPTANILIVDDNPVNLTVAKGLLEPLEMNIDTANGASETIDKVNKKMYDIIFMDHMMPEVDGVETTHIIRQLIPNYADVPIIALTANAIGGAKEMFLKEGMNDFIAKPIELKEIVSKIRKWLPHEKLIITEGEFFDDEPAQTEGIHIEGLNTEYALSLMGSEKLFWTVLKEYYCAMDRKNQVVREFWQSGDIKNYTIEVHSLKSTSKQIGSEQVFEMAAALEKAGNENDKAYIDAHTEEMLEKYMSYKEIFRPLFPELDIPEEKREASPEKISSLLDMLTAALDEMDILQIEEVLEEFDAFSFDEEQNLYLEDLKNASEEFDMELCGDIITQWRGYLNK